MGKRYSVGNKVSVLATFFDAQNTTTAEKWSFQTYGNEWRIARCEGEITRRDGAKWVVKFGEEGEFPFKAGEEGDPGRGGLQGTRPRAGQLGRPAPRGLSVCAGGSPQPLTTPTLSPSSHYGYYPVDLLKGLKRPLSPFKRT